MNTTRPLRPVAGAGKVQAQAGVRPRVAPAGPAPGRPPHTPEPTPPPGRLERLRTQARKPGEASFFYFDTRFRNDAVKVLPGEFFVHDEDILIMTTLGSCIAACLWDRERHIGGMNHFLLPEAAPGGAEATSGRYGAFAMAQLISELVQRGARRSSIEAKVFGGGSVISGMNCMNVGQRNTDFVLEYLRNEHITVIGKDVLDIYPRKVCFSPTTGQALVKRLASANTEAMAAQERAAASRVALTSATGAAIEFTRTPRAFNA